MPRIGVVTGIEDLDRNLKALGATVENRIAKKALLDGAKGLARLQAAAAPVGPSGNLKAAIAARAVSKSGHPSAKSGINVGKRQLGVHGLARAPHGHLVALGTKLRTRKRIGGKFRYLEPNAYHSQEPRSRSTGKMPANAFIRQIATSSEYAVRSAIEVSIRNGIAREVNRLGAKTGQAVEVL